MGEASMESKIKVIRDIAKKLGLKPEEIDKMIEEIKIEVANES